jgi:hypothetical protein
MVALTTRKRWDAGRGAADALFVSHDDCPLRIARPISERNGASRRCRSSMQNRRLAPCRSQTNRTVIVRAILIRLALVLCVVVDFSANVSADDVGERLVRITVPANQNWVNTHAQVVTGRTLTVVADGTIQVTRPGRANRVSALGPEGTFHFLDEESRLWFPLPAAGAGPAPAYALIGRLGENGRPFYIGRSHSILATQSGELWLGINDDVCRENKGQFSASIRIGGPLTPVSVRDRVMVESPNAGPLPDSRVLIFYVDGLRPDIVEEMSAMGHLPNITSTFLRGGTKLQHAYTVFPSDTITSNGTMWTGTFSDRHGVKGQIGFDRRSRRSQNYLGTDGPVSNGRFLMPQGLERGLLKTGEAAVRLTKGEAAAQDFYERRTSETPTAMHHLAEANKTFGAGILPVMSELTPALWTRYLTDEAPPFGTHQSERYVDEANTAYAVDNLFNEDHAVTVVWLPETDSASHNDYRGQFGVARRSIVEADGLIGEMVAELARRDRLKNTYLLLVSDHGHIGGRFGHLERYDLVNEFFHQPARVDDSGHRVGGGLGLSVRQYRYSNPTIGDDSDDFVFVDAVGTGAASVYLPRKHYGADDWSAPNSAADLMEYRIRDRAQPVNLIDELIHIGAAADQDGQSDSESQVVSAHWQSQNRQSAVAMPGPVDLVLARIDDESILIANAHRGLAVVDRRVGFGGQYEYRYRVVRNVRPTDDGSLDFESVTQPETDPLRMVGAVSPEVFGQYFDERSWLKITMGTVYPDSVVAMCRHMLWEPHLKARAKSHAADLVVTANPGWQFNNRNKPGTAHGHPFVETMRMSFFVAGPNIRRAAIVTDPVRSVDLLPTILEMAGVPFENYEFDGRPIRSIYQPEDGQNQTMRMPMIWQDVDLGAWAPRQYAPREVYPVQPKSVNRPDSFWDLNNAAKNALSVTELSVNRLFDDTVRLIGFRQRPTRTVYRWTQSELDRNGVTLPDLQLNKVSLGDYSWYSSGNLQRINNGTDWVQEKIAAADKTLAAPFGARTVLGTPLTNGAIDAVQYSAWELRRVGTYAATTVLDRWLLDGLEDRTDRVINMKLGEPAELPAD